MAILQKTFNIPCDSLPIALAKGNTVFLKNLNVPNLKDATTDYVIVSCAVTYEIADGKADVYAELTSRNEFRGLTSIRITCNKIYESYGGGVRITKLGLAADCIAKNELTGDVGPYAVNPASLQDAFENFEEYYAGERLLNAETFDIANGGGDSKNYQIFQSNGFTEAAMVATMTVGAGYAPLKGCRKGTVPKAGDAQQADSGDAPVKIWLENDAVKCERMISEGGKWRWSGSEYNCQVPNGTKRIGVLLVGAGGNGGASYEWQEGGSSNGVTYTAPGTSGGGGGVMWGVLNLERSSREKPYYIFPAAYKDNEWTATRHPEVVGLSGFDTYLMYDYEGDSKWLGWSQESENGILAIAHGGSGGQTGSNKGQEKHGNGGVCEVAPYNGLGRYFMPIGAITGGDGVGYSWPSKLPLVCAGNEFTIRFFDTGIADYEKHVKNDDLYNVGDESDITKVELPGGNSFEHGANVTNAVQAGFGGGGAGLTALRLEMLGGGQAHWALYY